MYFINDDYTIFTEENSADRSIAMNEELLLTVLPSMKFLTNPDILEELLPWNSAVQKICRIS